MNEENEILEKLEALKDLYVNSNKGLLREMMNNPDSVNEENIDKIVKYGIKFQKISEFEVEFIKLIKSLK